MPPARQHQVGRGAAFGGVAAQAAPADLAARGRVHAPAQQRVQLDGQQRRLVRPVFEQAPGFSPSGPIQQRMGIGAQPGECGQVVCSRHDVDAVDLVQRQPLEHAPQVAGVYGARRTRAAEALCRQPNPAALGQ
jgi:hypothetical protein